MFARRILYNLLSTLVNQVGGFVLGIIIPRLVLVNLGSEANGLLNSIGQILVYLGLLEAGVGMATLQALYGPVSQNDHPRINGILSATNVFYRRAGHWYLLAVFLLTFVFPFVIRSSLPPLTVMLVVFLSGLPGVIRFLYQGKYALLFQVEGKGYILSYLDTFVHQGCNVAKIILLHCGFGLVSLQFSFFLLGMVQVLWILFYVRRNYRWLDLDCEPDFKALSQSRSVLVHQISLLIFANTDVLLLSCFCNLKVVSVYVMYGMIFGIPMRFTSFFGSVVFVLGQTFSLDRARYLKMHDAAELYFNTLTFALLCSANLFILPFLKLYTKGVDDIDYLSSTLPYFFLVSIILSSVRWMSGQLLIFAGHFEKTQWRAVVEMSANLAISLALVSRFGIYGVLAGTIAALLYRSNDLIIYTNTRILDRYPWKSYRVIAVNIALFVILTLGGRSILSHVSLTDYFHLIPWGMLFSIVIVGVFLAVLSLCEWESCRFACSCIRSCLARVLRSMRWRFSPAC